jgi:hypothetical protein
MDLRLGSVPLSPMKSIMEFDLGITLSFGRRFPIASRESH